MRYPVNKVYITQAWGVNPDIYSRFGLKGHNGIDLRMFDEEGNRASTCKVFAPHSGTVLEAFNDINGYGKYLKIENSKFGSILGHNKELLVGKGDQVEEGQLVAIGDNTGWSTGAHVHWGLYPKPRDRDNGYSGTVDPAPYINNQGDMPETHTISKETFEELVGKSSQRDKVVNEYDFDIGTAKDDELLNKIKNREAGLKGEITKKENRIVELIIEIEQLNDSIEQLGFEKKELIGELESARTEIGRLKTLLLEQPPEPEIGTGFTWQEIFQIIINKLKGE